MLLMGVVRRHWTLDKRPLAVLKAAEEEKKGRHATSCGLAVLFPPSPLQAPGLWAKSRLSNVWEIR